MTVQTLPDQQASRPRRPWLEALLLTGFILFVVLGIVALAAFFLLRNADTTPTYETPLAALQPAEIRADLALLQLAGDPADGLAFQALNADELHTAHAIALFDTGFVNNPSTNDGTTVAGSPDDGLTGSKRAGFYQQLARSFLERSLPSAATVAYDTQRSLAMLDVELPALERSPPLIQAAEGFIALDNPAASLDAANQALLLGKQIPALLPAQRVPIFQALSPIAEELGDEALIAEVNELIRNPYLTPGGVLITPQLNALAEPVPLEQPLIDAMMARQLSANQLAERIKFTDGADIEPERQALAAALLREDQVRTEYYPRMAAAQLPPGQQLWLLQDQRAWVALKNRIAMDGFGLPIVPEWNANLPQLQQDLANVTGAFNAVIQALATTLIEPIRQQMLLAEGLQWLALQSELGLYPGANVNEINERLRVTQLALTQLSASLALPVAHDESASPAGFRIQSVPQ